MAAISVTHPLLAGSATGWAAGGRDSLDALVSGRYEPRHADAIVAADCDARSRTSTLRGIAQLTTR